MPRRSNYDFDPKKYEAELSGIISILLSKLEESEDDYIDPKFIEKTLKKFPKDKSKLFSRDQLISGISHLQDNPTLPPLYQRGGGTEGDGGVVTSYDWERLISALKMKPTRTISGVTTVTVLTKPYFCPGECIFCPNDVRMPKSYIATEPGAQRALMNRFSPYLQVWNRLKALQNIGHPTDKIELLVLGGTWSVYPEKYQIWFIRECFRAMNDFSRSKQSTMDDGRWTIVDQAQTSNNYALPTTTYQLDKNGFLFEGEQVHLKNYLGSDWNEELRQKTGDLPYNKLIKTPEFIEEFSKYICSEDSALNPKEGFIELEKLHSENVESSCRCVGLVLETRPDSITPRETLRLRKLGATKIQLGIQIVNDEVSALNKRGEGIAETSKAFRLLRAAGFKIHAHIMPNLYGATAEIDLKAWRDLFTMPEYKPDEVKIYPTSVIKNTELYNYFLEGKYRPYETIELVDLMAKMMEETPEYCRLTRIIRDIPSTEIEAGNKTTNLREIVEWKLAKEGRVNPNIRAREIKDKKVKFEDLNLDIIEFETTDTTEYFMQYITEKREIAGFLRLSIPKPQRFTSPQPSSQGEGENSQTSNLITSELDDCAMIREVHVYGQSQELKPRTYNLKPISGDAQHIGLGSRLIEKAKEISKEKGFEKLAVISAIGTREYYAKRGFKLDSYYQIANL